MAGLLNQAVSSMRGIGSAIVTAGPVATMRAFFSKRESLAAAAILAALAFVACYLRFLEFGLYEDDLNQTRFWTYTPGRMWEYVLDLFARGAGGRPVGLTFLRAGFWAGYSIGGIPILYLMGFAVFAANAFLTFKIVKAIAPASIALLAAMMFVFYPADALKFTIVRGLAVQPSLTFGLGAILCFIYGRNIIAYILSVLALAVYEFGFLPFLLAPFFILEGWRAKIWTVARHAVLAGAVLGGVILVRLQFATGHLDDLTPLSKAELINRFFVAWTTGPWTSLNAFITMPRAFFRDFEQWHLIIVLFVLVLSWASLRAFWTEPDQIAKPVEATPKKTWSERFDALFGEKNATLLILIGIAAWIVGYSMAVSESRFPPDKVFGRTTSVHTGATFGVALTFAGLVWLVSDGVRRLGLNPRNVVVPVVAAYLAVLGGFQGVVQSKVIQSWELQQTVWRQIMAQVEDWRDGTVVIVGYDRAPNTRYVYTQSWATQVIAENSFYFPKEWKQPPTIVFYPQLRYYSEVRNGELWLRYRPWFEKQPVDPEKLIYLSVSGKHNLKREQDKFEFREFSTKLSPPGPVVEIERKPLYDVLVGDGK